MKLEEVEWWLHLNGMFGVVDDEKGRDAAAAIAWGKFPQKGKCIFGEVNCYVMEEIDSADP